MEYRRDRNQAALEAARDEDSLDQFVSENRRFILNSASKISKRFITEDDVEYEIALVAFCEAVKTYDAGAGDFGNYAAMMIRRRLLDHLTRVYRLQPDAPKDEVVALDADVIPSGVRAELEKKLASQADADTIQDEVHDLAALLREYGLSFFDVADASPKSIREKGYCAGAVSWMLALPARLLYLGKKHRLPAREMSDECDIPTKVIERHGQYIIAATEILGGDFPRLGEYLQYIKRYSRP